MTRRQTGCLVFLAIFLLLGGWLGWKTVRIVRSTQSLLTQQARVEQVMAVGPLKADPATVSDLITTSQRDIDILHREIRPFFWLLRNLNGTPRVGALLAEAPNLLEMGDAGATMALELLPIIEPTLARLQSDSDQGSQIAFVNGLLAGNEAGLAAARTEAQRLMAAHAALGHRNELPGRLRQVLDKADPYVPLLDDGLRLASLLPSLTGADGSERFYLLLAQNEDELRGSGGFVSGIGRLQMRGGDIVLIDFVNADEVNANLLRESHLYDYPPEPMLRFMGLEYLVTRDATFWPDFPTSAETAARLYALGQPQSPPIDGVIAFDQRFMQMMIESLGAVDIPDLGIRINAANVIPRMRESWGSASREDGLTLEWLAERKSFMGSMAKAIMDRVMGDPGSIDLPALLDGLMNSGAQKHLQVWLTDPAAAAVIEGLGWHGRFDPPAQQDFLLALESNSGFNKSNALVQRELFYNVNLGTGGQHTATATLNYTHTGNQTAEPCVHLTSYSRPDLSYELLMQTCYYNYLRVYAPPGSRLIDAAEHSAPGDWFVTGRPWGPGWLLDLASEQGNYPLAATLRRDYDLSLGNGSAGFMPNQPEAAIFDNFFVLKQGNSLQTFFHWSLPPMVVQGNRDGSATYRLRLMDQAGAGESAVQVVVTVPEGATIVEATPVGAAVFGRTATFTLRVSADQEISVTYR